jgi:hypothetical protein
MSQHSYSGDVTITGDEQTPVELVDSGNVHVLRGAVDGDLKVVNAEYVFTNTPPGGTATIDQVATEIGGDIKDGYVVPEGTTGDVLIRDPEDVFIEHDAVGGELQIVGAEQQFHDDSAAHPPARDQYDETVTGWQRSTTLDRPTTGVAVAGGRCTADLRDVTGDIDVCVTGWQNTVEIRGSGTVSLHLAGSHNTIETGPYIDLTVASDTGVENTITDQPLPHEALIETTKREAAPFFGRAKVTYQTPAPDADHCQHCGAAAQTIIERHRLDAFFLFKRAVYRFEDGTSYRCEECSRARPTDATLSESERRDLFE